MVQYMDNQSGFNQWNQMNAKKPSRFSGFLWWLFLFFFAWWIMGVWFKPQNTEIKEVAPITVEQSNATKRNRANEDVSFDVQGLRISNVALNKHKKDSKTDEHVVLLNDANNFVEVGYVSSDISVPNINTQWEMKSGEMHWDNPSVHFARYLLMAML